MAHSASPQPSHPPVSRGHLVIVVEEASGKTTHDGHDLFTWDTNNSAGIPFEAFVRVEIRGGPRNVKAQTVKRALVGETITWQEELRLELLDNANELRLMLCREKFQGTKRGTSVIAACGIYVNDIIEACPIDKYFELFKPNNGGQGGFIRVNLSFVKDLADKGKGAVPSPAVRPAVSSPAPSGTVAEAGSRSQAVSARLSSQAKSVVPEAGVEEAGSVAATRKRGGKSKFLLSLLLVAATAGGVVFVREQRKKDRKQ